MRSLYLSLLASALNAITAHGKTVTYNFNLTWVHANPDNSFVRPVIGINGKWPLPIIEGDIDDHVVVNVDNQLGNRTGTLHFHGLFQNGTNSMDGPHGVTQCQFPAGSSFTYEFDLKQPGTYWYHAHNLGQYPDGLRGPLIIHDPKNPYKDQIDEEISLTLSDWYHDFMPDLIASFIAVTNPSGAEPVPQAALMNDTQDLSINVQPGKTYFIRIVNMGAFAAQYLWFEGHSFRVIEVDGEYTEPMETDMIYITPAQRYGLLLTTKNNTSQNFAIQGSMDQDLFDQIPEGLNPNVTGWLVYDDKASKDPAKPIDDFDAALDDTTLVPQDNMELLDPVDHTIQLDFQMDNLGDGANYAFFNGISYVQPIVPTLYTALSAGELATDPRVYGTYTNPFVLKHGEVVEIVLNSADPGKHPFHLHGHAFQVAYRGDEEQGNYNATNTTLIPTPMRRDTILVKPDSHVVLRFRADNPGIWLFHCHIQWHMDSGLAVTMIEAPLEMQKQNIPIPEDHKEACRKTFIPLEGNAAGNSKDFLDLTGEKVNPPPLPAGFETKGIVALVFSVLAAFIGMAVVTWYGIGEIKGGTAKSS